MMRIKELLQNIINRQKTKVLTLTRENNTYVNATAFNRLAAYQVGNITTLSLNLQVSTSMPAGTGSTKIGTINLPYPVYYAYASITPQNGTGTLLVTVQTDGSIYIQNASSAAVSGFVRASIPLVCSRLV